MLFRQPPSVFPYMVDYLGRTTQFCPFLKPSMEKEHTYFSQYTLSGDTLYKLQEQMFCYCLAHTELLRYLRHSSAQSLLLCENLLFEIDTDIKIDGKALFSWPHWCLKTLYTKAGILFGKFWEGEQDTAKNGEMLPVPPQHFMSIRSALKAQDMRFFTKAHNLKPNFEAAEDQGQNCFQILNVPNLPVPAFAEFDLQNPEQLNSAIQDWIQTLLNSQIYRYALDYAQAKHKEA